MNLPQFPGYIPTIDKHDSNTETIKINYNIKVELYFSLKSGVAVDLIEYCFQIPELVHLNCTIFHNCSQVENSTYNVYHVQ